MREKTEENKERSAGLLYVQICFYCYIVCPMRALGVAHDVELHWRDADSITYITMIGHRHAGNVSGQQEGSATNTYTMVDIAIAATPDVYALD